MNRIDQLLREANDDATPSAADLDRVKRGLDAKLFGAGVAGAALVTKTAVASKAAASIAPKATGLLFAWKWIGIAIVGVSAVGGLVITRTSSRERSEERAATQPGSQTRTPQATDRGPSGETAALTPAATIAREPNVERAGVDKPPEEGESVGATRQKPPTTDTVSPESIPHAAPNTRSSANPAATAMTNIAPLPVASRRAVVTGAAANNSPAAVREKERLAEETALVREMGSALAKGDHPKAILLAEEHSRLFPSGLLKDEREAARSIAQCKTGLQDKSEIFRRYVRTVASNTSYARVKEACSGSTP